MKYVWILSTILFTAFTSASTITVGEQVVNYSVRDANYNKALDKLNIDAEIALINEELPSESVIAAVSEAILADYPDAKMTWLGYYLPLMKSDAGYYATDHRAPNPEGVKILSIMLYNTSYRELIE